MCHVTATPGLLKSFIKGTHIFMDNKLIDLIVRAADSVKNHIISGNSWEAELRKSITPSGIHGKSGKDSKDLCAYFLLSKYYYYFCPTQEGPA